MFDFAVVHCLVLFHLGSERSVATVQLHRTTALAEADNYATWREGLRSQIITNWQAMSEGARLPACGTQKNCDWCDARGLCRKGVW